MPEEKPLFQLHVEGVKDWSWADIQPNWLYAEQEGKDLDRKSLYGIPSGFEKKFSGSP
jgi:hypothetical protein